MYTRTSAKSSRVAPRPGMSWRWKFASEIKASMLSSVCWVCPSTSSRWRLSESVMLAVPETKIVAQGPQATAMARENLGLRGL